MQTVCVIPARMAASRFPGKPLRDVGGLPLISHVYRRCRLADGITRVVVATCDDEIRRVVEAEGGLAIMTSPTHERATDRVAEAVTKLTPLLAADDLVIMVQGDEILVSPPMLESVVRVYEADRPDVVNVVSRLTSIEEHDSAHTVKVVIDEHDSVMYMSRAPIPSRVRSGDAVPMYQQTGIIGFQAGFLQRFATLPPTALERIESIDMLRTLGHGYRIKAVRIERPTVGVDTPEDVARAVELLNADEWTARYLVG